MWNQRNIRVHFILDSCKGSFNWIECLSLFQNKLVWVLMFVLKTWNERYELLQVYFKNTQNERLVQALSSSPFILTTKDLGFFQNRFENTRGENFQSFKQHNYSIEFLDDIKNIFLTSFYGKKKKQKYTTYLVFCICTTSFVRRHRPSSVLLLRRRSNIHQQVYTRTACLMNEQSVRQSMQVQHHARSPGWW